MSDFIDFVVRFKEQGLAAVTSNSNSLLGAINKTLNNTQSKAKPAMQSIADINRQLDALKKRRDISIDTRQITAANREIASLEQRVKQLSGNSSSGGSLFGAVAKGTLVAGAASGILGMVKDTAISSVMAAMDFGTKLKSFEVLTGNAGRGRQLASSLRDMKMNTLVGGGVYQNAQTMLGFGVNQNSILKKIHEVGDVGMGDTDRMSALTLARSQTTAAGKLMGQDLLQYINAGFNPLSVMADKWQEFGFKTKMSIGALKDLMEEGKISSAMVDKSFELATSKGGRFYNMMDQIGETAGGKFLKLKGAWAATQIDIGNSLMPFAGTLMEATSGLLHWMNISQTVPETLASEKTEINTLVGTITNLNSKNEVRALLLDKLKTKYPDMFGDLDREKAKNEDLLKILDKVNDAYNKRIDVAEHAQIANEAKEERNSLLDLAQKARMQASYNKRHHGVMDEFKYLGVLDRLKMAGGDFSQYGDRTEEGLLGFANAAEKRAGELNGTASSNQAYVTASNNNNLLTEARKLIGNTKAQKELWGKDYAKNAPLFGAEVSNWQKMYKENNGQFTGSFLNYDYKKLQGLVHPDSIDNSGLSGVASDTGSKISGGGARQIVVNINAPMIKDQVFHVASMGEAKEYSLREQTEIFARVLQSLRRGV